MLSSFLHAAMKIVFSELAFRGNLRWAVGLHSGDDPVCVVQVVVGIRQKQHHHVGRCRSWGDQREMGPVFNLHFLLQTQAGCLTWPWCECVGTPSTDSLSLQFCCLDWQASYLPPTLWNCSDLGNKMFFDWLWQKNPKCQSALCIGKITGELCQQPQ